MLAAAPLAPQCTHSRQPLRAARLGLQRPLRPCRAGAGDGQQQQQDALAESRVEALEAAIKRKAPKPARQIPIRGVTQPQPQQESSKYAEWKAGKLFPEGWEQMPLDRKATELYLGQRGMLFWATKAAWASSIGLGVVWVLFRLVLPNLGVYQLPGDL